MKHAIILKSRKATSRKPIDDPDNPPWSEEMLGPPVVRRSRGHQKAPTKVLTTIRLDADVVAFFRAQGPGYQVRINEVLKQFVARSPTTRSNGRAKSAARRGSV